MYEHGIRSAARNAAMKGAAGLLFLIAILVSIPAGVIAMMGEESIPPTRIHELVPIPQGHAS
ncbi:hypothetical protein PCASD_16011 [Puccinia coronata f. sp. avenae]|uniref:Uncharacterized protein n=1 Tax=Puccinia coronata f. sp. avenae TaxID=200324 RepID=A0A2N5TZT4_9BASI|nr:hypothetical protein PCASD_16011 [Puccinia coronata f. sp. avenae]